MLSLDRKLRNLPGEFAGYLSRLSIRVRCFRLVHSIFLCDLQTAAMQATSRRKEKKHSNFPSILLLENVSCKLTRRTGTIKHISRRISE